MMPPLSPCCALCRCALYQGPCTPQTTMALVVCIPEAALEPFAAMRTTVAMGETPNWQAVLFSVLSLQKDHRQKKYAVPT